MATDIPSNPVVYGTLTARNPDDVTQTRWTETGRWVAAEDYEQVLAALQKWERECTGKHGSQVPCSAHETLARHLQPRYVLEQIMNHSTDSWAKGVARTCLMQSPEETTERRECQCATYCMLAVGAKMTPEPICRGLPGERSSLNGKALT